MIDNRPSWRPLRLCDKFGSQGDQIGTKNVFQPQSRRGGSFDLVLAKRILRAKDKSDRACCSCGRKMKTLHQLYSFVSSALFSSENEKSESEERFKRPAQYPASRGPSIFLDKSDLSRKIEGPLLAGYRLKR